MSEETPSNANSQEPGTGSEEQQQHQQQDVESRIKEIAIAAGWRENGPLGAEEFLKTMPERFKAKGNELKELRQSVKAIEATFHKATAAQYAKGIVDAEQRMKEAERTMDFEAFKKAQAERDKIQQMQQQEVRQEPETLPEVQEFLERNPWFDKDKEMTADALMYKASYLQANPKAAAGDVLAYVERKIRKDYPDQFKAPEKKGEPKPGASTETGRNGSGSLAQWEKDKQLLTGIEKEMMKTMCGETRNGKPVMTEQKYIESLRANGAFEGRK